MENSLAAIAEKYGLDTPLRVGPATLEGRGMLALYEVVELCAAQVDPETAARLRLLKTRSS